MSENLLFRYLPVQKRNENSSRSESRMQTAPFGRVKVRFHCFDLLEVKRHVRSENDIDDDTAELSETNESTAIKLTRSPSLTLGGNITVTVTLLKVNILQVNEKYKLKGLFLKPVY